MLGLARRVEHVFYLQVQVSVMIQRFTPAGELPGLCESNRYS